MAALFWLTRAQIRRIAPHFPLSHGVTWVDDQRVVSGIIHVICNGLRWRTAPAEYGPQIIQNNAHAHPEKVDSAPYALRYAHDYERWKLGATVVTAWMWGWRSTACPS